MGQGYVRKVGPGTYQTIKLTPKAVAAIEKDILQDLPEIKKGLGGGSIIIDSAERGTQEIPARDFIEKYKGDLDKAMARHGDQPGHEVHAANSPGPQNPVKKKIDTSKKPQ